jgi:hypothetical protein
VNTLNTSAPWVPYKIPACPSVNAGDNYALSAKVGADPSKNPSQFLEWKEVLPKGNDDDILKWSGDKWVVSSPSGSAENPKFLKYNGSELFWGEGGTGNIPNGTNKGDILYWDPEAGEEQEGAWVVLSAPSESDISIKKFDVCENGQPKEYHMLVWDQG